VGDSLTSGIEVAEQGGAGHPIARAATAIVAFVGRTLRGPVNRPVTLKSFAEFQSVFGGLWQPSPLSYAVMQFYENGGGTALIVRVVNGGRPPSLSLPGPAGPLSFTALASGTREFLRAAVDYDGCGGPDSGYFNLTVQRVRAPGSEHVEDQEIYRRVSVDPDSPRYLLPQLADSALVRLSGTVPAERPHGTTRGDGYLASNGDGDDGGPLTDYDLIGSASAGTGLFALKQAAELNFLYLPPLTREQAVGPSALLVAARYCRERRAMLLVDPPDDWKSPEEALRGLRELPFRSEHALMYYPRILAYDRLRGRFESFAPSGAAAGMLARLDAQSPLWSPADVDDAALRPGLRPAVAVGEASRARLVGAGINVLSAVRPRSSLGARTLAGPMASAPDWKYLGLRRLSLFLAGSLEHGTRWVLFEKSSPALWHRLRTQVAEFLAALEGDGAFAGRAPGESWFVICDERINSAGAPGAAFLFGVAALREGDYHCFLVSHAPGGGRVQHVTINRLQSAGGRSPLDPELDVATLFAGAFTR
jgi:uncharacterized protein